MMSNADGSVELTDHRRVKSEFAWRVVVLAEGEVMDRA